MMKNLIKSPEAARSTPTKPNKPCPLSKKPPKMALNPSEIEPTSETVQRENLKEQPMKSTFVGRKPHYKSHAHEQHVCPPVPVQNVRPPVRERNSSHSGKFGPVTNLPVHNVRKRLSAFPSESETDDDITDYSPKRPKINAIIHNSALPSDSDDNDRNNHALKRVSSQLSVSPKKPKKTGKLVVRNIQVCLDRVKVFKPQKSTPSPQQKTFVLNEEHTAHVPIKTKAEKKNDVHRADLGKYTKVAKQKRILSANSTYLYTSNKYT